MCPIQSIICFNSGSGGDFLKAICNKQLVDDYQYDICDDGTVDLNNNNFKKTIEKIFYKELPTDAITDIDNEPIENTHYFVDQLKDLTTNLFYIEYPNDVAGEIIKVYVKKRLNGNHGLFFDEFKNSLPHALQSKIRPEVLYKSSEINWTKNINAWRTNDSLQPILL